jgi:hypothetical protein
MPFTLARARDSRQTFRHTSRVLRKYQRTVDDVRNREYKSNAYTSLTAFEGVCQLVAHGI